MRHNIFNNMVRATVLTINDYYLTSRGTAPPPVTRPPRKNWPCIFFLANPTWYSRDEKSEKMVRRFGSRAHLYTRVNHPRRARVNNGGLSDAIRVWLLFGVLQELCHWSYNNNNVYLYFGRRSSTRKKNRKKWTGGKKQKKNEKIPINRSSTRIRPRRTSPWFTMSIRAVYL